MPDAISMLREDHQRVQQMFEEFEKAEGASKREIAQRAIQELEIHALLEEEIFYPAVREEIEEPELVDEALEEHHVVKLLADELKKLRGNDRRFEAKFKVMAESTKHHIEEEENEVFPQVEDKLDGEELGQQMEQRKQKLQSRMSSRSTASRRSPRAAKGRSSRSKSKSSSGKKRSSRSSARARR